jgi:hypothetical protein
MLWGHRIYAPLLLLGRRRKNFHMPEQQAGGAGRAAVDRAFARPF